jgi:hypothetical protein
MRFRVQVLLSFLVGLAMGYVPLSVWDVMGALDSFKARFRRL